jgi:hypothetical protein
MKHAPKIEERPQQAYAGITAEVTDEREFPQLRRPRIS